MASFIREKDSSLEVPFGFRLGKVEGSEIMKVDSSAG
jgi:hypothetical protein